MVAVVMGGWGGGGGDGVGWRWAGGGLAVGWRWAGGVVLNIYHTEVHVPKRRVQAQVF